MQRYLVYLTHGQVDLLNDNITMVKKKAEAAGTYLLDTKPLEPSYDFIIVSAADPLAYMHKQKGKLILVVSSIPDINSDKWPGFFTNLCMADMICCDSYTKDQLTKYSFPEKRTVILDGCSPVDSRPIDVLDQYPNKIQLLSLDLTNSSIWSKFVEHILSDSKLSKKFQITTTTSKYAVGIGFYPVGNALATFMTHKLRHISVAYEERTSIYLDARSNHRIHHQIGNLINVQGGGTAQKVKETFTTYIDELQVLLDHSKEQELFKFTSNASIYDRIFYEVNRS